MEGSVFAFLFAHPDDEVFIAGTMRLLLDRGAEVHGIWVTDGDFLGQGRVRMRELAKACSILGLEESHVHLMNQPDGGIIRNLNQAVDCVARTLKAIAPEVVCVTAFEGGHPDHDLTNFLAYEASYRVGIEPQIFEFPLYNGTGPLKHWRWRINEFPRGGPSVSYTILDDSAICRKHKMMRVYASQWMYMIPARLVCTYTKLQRIGEPYRACPSDRDHTLRPHPGQLNYERWFCRFLGVRFGEFEAAVKRARTRLLVHEV